MNNHDNPYQIIQQTLSAPSRDTCRYEPRFYSSFVVIPFQMPKLDGMIYQKTDLCTELQIKIIRIKVKGTVFCAFFYNFVHGTIPFNQYFDESLVGNLSYLICILWSREMGLPQSTKSAPFNRYLFGTNSSLLLVDTKSKSILET